MTHAVRAYVASWRRLAVIVIVAVAATAMAMARFIDGDEGFFLVAARLVSEGLRPYHDFFHIHSPMVAYAWGAWFKVLGPGWYVARVLSAIVAAALGLLIYDHLRRGTGKERWALAGVFLYLASGLAAGWFTITKTLGLSALFTFAGTAALTRRGRHASLLGGVLLGLAASTRLYLLITVLTAVVFVVRREGDLRRGAREVGWLALGTLIGLIPLLLNLARDPQALIFGTVEYHALRDVRHAGVVGDWPQKWATLRAILGLEKAEGPGSYQLLALLITSVIAFFARGRASNSLFAYNWIALFAVSILPTPSYEQYYCLLVPFLIVETVELLARFGAVWYGVFVAVALAGYGWLGVKDIRRYCVTGVNVPGVLSPDRTPRWSIPLVRRVSRAIDEQNRPVGASWWPGYFLSSRTPVLLDLANDFGMVIGDQVTPARRRRFHIRTHGEVSAMIRAHDPSLFVEGNWAFRPSADELPRAGYRVAASVGPVRIWVVP